MCTTGFETLPSPTPQFGPFVLLWQSRLKKQAESFGAGKSASGSKVAARRFGNLIRGHLVHFDV